MLITNCPCAFSATLVAQVFASTSPRIGLCLDTAWALDAHEDPVAMAGKFADRLYGVQFLSQFASVLIVAFMAVVLAIRPNGLFGAKES